MLDYSVQLGFRLPKSKRWGPRLRVWLQENRPHENLADNAIGHNQVVQLTQPFRRIGAERTGSDNGAGLGLAIVSSIVEVHGGALDLEALSDGGLCVAITLPLTVRTAAGAAA